MSPPRTRCGEARCFQLFPGPTAAILACKDEVIASKNGELRLADACIAAKDECIAAADACIAAKDECIAGLKRNHQLAADIARKEFQDVLFTTAMKSEAPILRSCVGERGRCAFWTQWRRMIDLCHRGRTTEVDPN